MAWCPYQHVAISSSCYSLKEGTEPEAESTGFKQAVWSESSAAAEIPQENSLCQPSPDGESSCTSRYERWARHLRVRWLFAPRVRPNLMPFVTFSPWWLMPSCPLLHTHKYSVYALEAEHGDWQTLRASPDETRGVGRSEWHEDQRRLRSLHSVLWQSLGIRAGHTL